MRGCSRVWDVRGCSRGWDVAAQQKLGHRSSAVVMLPLSSSGRRSSADMRGCRHDVGRQSKGSCSSAEVRGCRRRTWLLPSRSRCFFFLLFFFIFFSPFSFSPFFFRRMMLEEARASALFYVRKFSFSPFHFFLF